VFSAFEVFGLFAYVMQVRGYWQEELKNAPLLRREIIERLRDASWGGHYRGSLERALAWLNRMFGKPGSAEALGLCILIAVGYAYATFFLGWGLGGSGRIAGFKFLSETMAQPGRGIAALVLILLPVAAFFLGRWFLRHVDRWERRFKVVLLIELSRI